MRAFVFTDKALKKHAGQFVWLSIDTEKAQNAPFLKEYPIRAWPSLYVIDPERESVALRWVGGATVAQLERIFDDGGRAVRGGERGAEEALAKADALYGQGSYKEAAPVYREALRELPAGSPRYGRVVESLLFCFQSTDQDSECMKLAREALPKLRHTPSAANLAASGLDCALDLPVETPGRADSVAALEAAAGAVVADRKLKLAADDRSAVYETLVSARKQAKDLESVRRIAGEWVAYLDAEAARAETPEQRTALDPNRLGAFQAADAIEKAIPMLERSEKDFPDDYSPSARLGFVYLQLKRYDEALAASDRALARVYGPRRIRVLRERADILKGQGNADAAKKTLEEALAFAESLPEGQRSESTIASLKKRLESP